MGGRQQSRDSNTICCQKLDDQNNLHSFNLHILQGVVSFFISCSWVVRGIELISSSLLFGPYVRYQLSNISMATSTVEAIYVPNNIDGKDYLDNQRWRLRIWICSGISMMIVLSTALALIIQILNFSTFLSQTYDLAEGDMRLISVSTAFCEEISLGRDSSKRKLWIVPSSHVSPQLRQTNMSTEVFVSKFKYWYKRFYLLEGSSVIINAKSESSLKLFIFKDRKRLDEWLDHNSDSTDTISSDKKFSSQSSRISYTLDVHETGNYFILFSYARGKKDFTRMKLDLILNRRVYDLESSIFSCSAASKETCSARLLFGSSEVGVLEVTNEPSYLSNELISTWQCEPRIWFYVAVFVGPILFVIVASFVFYFVLVNRTRDRHLQRLAIQRQQVLRRTSNNGCERTNSFGNNRSLNASVRRSPSRTPSTRSLGNQSDISRATCLQPFVTTMYTGNSISEDSGHDTDEDDKRTSNSVRPQQRTSSVDGGSLVSGDSVSRRPSFSTFQGSEDENLTVRNIEAVPSHDRSGRVRDKGRGRRSADEKAQKASSKIRLDRNEMRDKIPNGSLPRRYSSDELHDRTIKTLPRNRGNTAPPVHHVSQRALKAKSLPSRPASLPCLQQPDGAWALPSDLELNCRPKGAGSISEDDFHPAREESTIEPQEIKLRTHSGRRREQLTIKTLPQNRGNTAPPVHPVSQRAPKAKALPSRPASLSCLQQPDGAWALPSDLELNCRPKEAGSISEDDFHPAREESTIEPQEIKLRTHSGRRREMGWSPRLSMVSEV